MCGDKADVLLRAVHTLAYWLGPCFSRAQDQTDGVEVGEAVSVLKVPAEDHDTRAALLEANDTDVLKLLTDFPRPTSTNIMVEFTGFRSRTGGELLMDSTWEEGTIRSR